MEFPNEIKREILSYLPHPYKKPSHVEAINKTPLFADFTIERLIAAECEEEDEPLWNNSYIEYRKWRFKNRYVYPSIHI